MTVKELAGDKQFYKQAIKFGVPVALQNLLTSSASFVDSMMIGGFSEIAIGAVGMAGQWFYLIMLCCWGIHSAGTMFFAQYWGANDKEGLRKATWVMFTSVLFLTVPVSIVTCVFPRLIMSIYTNDPGVISIGGNYLRIAAFNCVFTAITTGCSGLLRSTGNAKLPLYAGFAGIFTNIFLNWVLIYGNLGFPALGVVGAAIATVISGFVNMAILIATAIIKKNILFEMLKKKAVIAKSFVKEYYAKATPIILNESCYAVAMLIINMVFGRQGGRNMSALSIFRTLDGIVLAFYYGFVNASCVMIGNSIGAGRIKEGIVYSRRFTILNFLTTVVVTLTIYLFRYPIISLFSVGQDITDIVSKLLLILVIFMPIRTCNYMLIGVYRSGGESKIGFYFEIIAIWFVSVPLVLLSGLHWKLSFPLVVMMSYSEDVAKIVVQLWYMLSNKWIKPITEQG
ncbi:MAG: MATE family efflux transporter, partial [Clostridiales bacterium]|nr:MATE family efflux transporter [Clostridiales bacterium]